MKVILSRKGFDSKFGGMPSPIMPDNTLLSMPIPSLNGNNKYSDLQYGGISYETILKKLRPKKYNAIHLKYKGKCHLDPDLRRDII
jgi:hypothetical protein